MDDGDGYDMVRLGRRRGDCKKICKGTGREECALKSGMRRDASCKADATQKKNSSVICLLRLSK